MFASKRHECTVGNREVRLVMPTPVFKMLKCGDHFKIRAIAALRAMYPEISLTLVETKWIVEFINGQQIWEIKSYANTIIDLSVAEMPEEDYLYGGHTVIALDYRSL